MPLTSYVPHEPLSSYEERLEEHFLFSRSDDGVLEVRMHTGGGEALWGLEKHRTFGQMLEAVAADRDNQVLILTGTGPNWIMNGEPASYRQLEDRMEDFRRGSYEIWHHDTKRIMEMMVEIDIPTIGVVNGPGTHTETLVMCDLTICSQDAVFFDTHLEHGAVPGDGELLTFQQLIGIKRANFAVLTGQRIDSRKALEWGLVNEVHPTEELMPRARELADIIMESHPITRRVTTQVMRRPWRRAVTDDLDVHLAARVYAASVTSMQGRHEGSAWPLDPVRGRDRR